jgi:hypothetical protein
LTGADKEMTVYADFDVPANCVGSEELRLLQNFLSDLIGEALRDSDFNEE